MYSAGTELKFCLKPGIPSSLGFIQTVLANETVKPD
jgi:hypothetical protein